MPNKLDIAGRDEWEKLYAGTVHGNDLLASPVVSIKFGSDAAQISPDLTNMVFNPKVTGVMPVATNFNFPALDKVS